MDTSPGQPQLAMPAQITQNSATATTPQRALMARLVLLIALAAIGLLVWHKIRSAPPAEKPKVIFLSLLAVFGLLLLLLALSGHLNVITAALAALLAAAPRLGHLARYLPVAQKFFHQKAGAGHAETNRQRRAPAGEAMSREQALAILGLEEGCSREQILAAHKRMMQRVHPDRGGSDYLASQINQARDTLLG